MAKSRSRIKQILTLAAARRALSVGRVLKKPLLVLFKASWCGHCKPAELIVSEAAKVLAADGLVVTVRTFNLELDEGNRLARALGIRSIPMLLLWNGGTRTEGKDGLALPDSRLVGAVKADVVVKFVLRNFFSAAGSKGEVDAPSGP